MTYPVSVFALMVIACWLACLLVEAAFLLFDSEWVGRWLRPWYAQRLAKANFSRMLQRHGIEPVRYLTRASANQVRSDLTRCEGCAEKRQCETALAQEHPLEDKIGFCANRKTVERMVRQSERA